MKCLEILSKDVIDLLERNKLLERLIECELQSNIVRNVQLDESIYDDAKKIFMQTKNLSTEEEFQEWLLSNSHTEEEILYMLVKPFKIHKHCSENFSHQVHSHFLSRKSDLDQIIYSLIRVKDFFVAKELYLRLESNEETFANMSKQYSEGNEKNRMGLVGPVALSAAHPDLVNILRKSKVGELSEPFKVNEHWVIIRVESFIEATLDAEMEGNLGVELFNLYIQEESKSIIKNLKQRTSEENKQSLTN